MPFYTGGNFEHLPMAAEVVLAITVAILVILFSAQRFGTDAVGAAFAPILIAWFLAIAGENYTCKFPYLLSSLCSASRQSD